MEENKNLQAETVGEEQLEEVAGGNCEDKYKCYFEPENPPDHKVEHGLVWVKCKSSCHPPFNTCHCHNTIRCFDRWHVVEHATPGLVNGNWTASPRAKFNHGEGRKWIKNLFV